ncbi:MAG: hypothetical protein ACXAD7_09135 [Candidatus Kariarchaeaceae archaeon]
MNKLVNLSRIRKSIALPKNLEKISLGILVTISLSFMVYVAYNTLTFNFEIPPLY